MVMDPDGTTRPYKRAWDGSDDDLTLFTNSSRIMNATVFRVN